MEKVETTTTDKIDTNKHFLSELDEDQSQYRVLKILKDGTALMYHQRAVGCSINI